MTVRIGMIDSGVNAGHPHIGNFRGGVCFAGGEGIAEITDALGHGTAVAAAIHELAPSAQLYSARVFDSRLSCTIRTLLAALDWCLDQHLDLINLSLGTANPEHASVLTARLARAGSQGSFIVTAAGMLPGVLDGAIAVRADAAVPRGQVRFADGTFWASPYPRDIPGVRREQNLHGQSFAVANFTGVLAHAMNEMPACEALGKLSANRLQFQST